MAPELVLDAVDRHMSTRWKWGVSDCCMAARDVFAELHGIDAMSHIKNYNCAVSAILIVRRHGGFVSIIEDAMRRHGLRDGVGKSGEVGISHYGVGDGIEGRAMLICVEPGAWAGKTEYGYAILPSAERYWRV